MEALTFVLRVGRQWSSWCTAAGVPVGRDCAVVPIGRGMSLRWRHRLAWQSSGRRMVLTAGSRLMSFRMNQRPHGGRERHREPRLIFCAGPAAGAHEDHDGCEEQVIDVRL